MKTFIIKLAKKQLVKLLASDTIKSAVADALSAVFIDQAASKVKTAAEAVVSAIARKL